MPKAYVSVIIPVYKVEDYLEKCVDSVLNQTMKELEIILVDDGSPDDCGKICDAYSEKDSRVRVIHQENRGLSAARNAGIDFATCEYVGFVDSDDWIEPDMYEFLYRNITVNNADIATCGICGRTKTDGASEKNSGCKLVTVDEAMPFILRPSEVDITAWNKLYRKSLFSKLRFPEGKVYEDVYLIPRVFGRAKTVALSTVPKYHYYRRAGSITETISLDYDRDGVEAANEQFKYIDSTFPHHAHHVQLRQLIAHFKLLDSMLMTDQVVDLNEKRQTINYLRSKCAEIMRIAEFTKRRKLAYLFLLAHEKLYKLAISFYYRDKKSI